MKKLIQIFTIFLCAATIFMMTQTKIASAEIKPDDFTVRGVKLDAPFDIDVATKAFGAPMFDKEKSVFGWRVKYYIFDHCINVGVVGADENVVDIVIRDEKYEGRDGMKQGATGYYMKKVYGKPERVQLDGATYNVYYNPENKKERLMLKTDTMNNTLLSWRLTSLPITEEEADDRYDEWESNELGAMGISIDASAMSESGNASYEDGRFTKFEDDGIDGGNVIDGGDPDMIARDNAAKKARE